ncbi:MAG: lytic transglycosylase domain-containing protein [Nocardioidaceae bacterium]
MTPRGSVLRRCLTRSAALTGVAVAATGLAVTSGIVLRDAGSASVAVSSSAAVAQQSARPTDSVPARLGAAALGRRDSTVSRSLTRTAARATVDPVKKATLDQRPGGATTKTEDLTHRDPRTIAKAMLGGFGFGGDQFSCLDSIYSQESGWNVHADNPSSSAYGIPQALPGSKMATAGGDWATNPATQIRWGLGYIKGRYGSPCSAWGFKQSHGWY